MEVNLLPWRALEMRRKYRQSIAWIVAAMLIAGVISFMLDNYSYWQRGALQKQTKSLQLQLAKFHFQSSENVQQAQMLSAIMLYRSAIKGFLATVYSATNKGVCMTSLISDNAMYRLFGQAVSLEALNAFIQKNHLQNVSSNIKHSQNGFFTFDLSIPMPIAQFEMSNE